MIEENGINNTVFADRVTLTPGEVNIKNVSDSLSTQMPRHHHATTPLTPQDRTSNS